MFERWRQKSFATVLLSALLVAAIGPGLALHGLGDAMHDAAHGQHHAIDIADLADPAHDDDATCAYDHDDDQSHATGTSFTCLTPPQVAMLAPIAAARVIYPSADGNAPPSSYPSDIDRPPQGLAFA